MVWWASPWSWSSTAQFSASGGVLPYSWTPTGSPPLPEGLIFDSGAASCPERRLRREPTPDHESRVWTRRPVAQTQSIIRDHHRRPGTAPDYDHNTAARRRQPKPNLCRNPDGDRRYAAPRVVARRGTSLPPGLTLSSGGTIGGTPTKAGTFNFTVQATDATAPTAMTATQPLSIVVGPKDSLALRLPPASQRTGRVGQSSFFHHAYGGGWQCAYAWSVGPGTSPEGLTMNARSGAITGTPTSNGSFTFPLDVTDSEQPAADGQRAAHPRHQSASSGDHDDLAAHRRNGRDAVLGHAPSGGGHARLHLGRDQRQSEPRAAPHHPQEHRVSPDPSTGIISGTPTRPGTATFVVHVTDAGTGKPGDPVETAKLQFTLTVAPLPWRSPTASAAVGTAGRAYSTPLTGTGGYTPYSWSLASGSLPAGLSLNATSGKKHRTGSPTTAGTFNLTVQVADQAQRP